MVFDFAELNERLRNRVELDCADCGETFKAMPDQTLCTQCEFHRKNPELAPKYWTWTRGGEHNDWLATARWPEKEPFPEPGERITMHRKDGSTSLKTIQEVVHHHFDQVGELRLVCTVT